jgi:hypothetical protein
VFHGALRVGMRERRRVGMRERKRKRKRAGMRRRKRRRKRKRRRGRIAQAQDQAGRQNRYDTISPTTGIFTYSVKYGFKYP